MRIRGNASQVHEKYLAMARDASSSGDRIASENYLQHAEHYYRILATQREEAEARSNNQQSQRNNGNGRQPRNEESAETAANGAENTEQPAAEVDNTDEMPAFVTKKVPEPVAAPEETAEAEEVAESAVGDD